MQKLWIANIAPGTSDKDLKAFVAKYAPEAECTHIQRVEGDGSRPAAVMTFAKADFVTIGRLQARLDGMFWNGRTLSCSTTIR
ncbi:MAG: hypothetical protein BroJett026_20110 [Betaproteobacteria bacterium]|nr:MAG: hypothetical protein BroJett026_20110 [Betaproteobacteria bacterium]